MVPLEPEPLDREAPVLGESTAPTAAGATAPISVLSRLALKDAMLEVEATARRTRDLSSAAVHQLWQSAERNLGLEVDIDDPALRGLFGVHVLAIEELCARLRAQVQSFLAAADAFSQPQLKISAPGLRLLCDLDAVDGVSSSEVLEGDLWDADQAMSRARTRLDVQIQSEVLGILDARLAAHAVVRDEFRERQRWRAIAERLLRDVTRLRKGATGSSGLRSLSGRPPSGPLKETETRMQEAMTKAAELDNSVLSKLLELQLGDVEAVQRPWAALLQIQSEYYMAQQAAWAPLADAFGESVAGPAGAAVGTGVANGDLGASDIDCYY